ncbi:MAG: RnfABCDGE type electron transport complex subunit G [Bacteroidales bacterium]
MAKLESSFKNMVLVLTAITCIAAAALAGVYELTKEPINQSNLTKQINAIKAVCPPFDNDPMADKIESKLPDGSIITIYPAKEGGKFVGAAVETYTMKGFSGYIKLMVGFNANGTVNNYAVLQHAETPGLGSKMQEWFSNTDKPSQSIIGKNPGVNKLTVSKDGGEVDAITAATISSRAFLDAVQRGYDAVKDQLNQ